MIINVTISAISSVQWANSGSASALNCGTGPITKPYCLTLKTEVLLRMWNCMLSNEAFLFLDKWPTWRTILFYVFIFIFNSLHVSSTSCSSSGERNCVNATSGNCHSVLVALSFALPTSTQHGHRHLIQVSTKKTPLYCTILHKHKQKQFTIISNINSGYQCTYIHEMQNRVCLRYMQRMTLESVKKLLNYAM